MKIKIVNQLNHLKKYHIKLKNKLNRMISKIKTIKIFPHNKNFKI